MATYTKVDAERALSEKGYIVSLGQLDSAITRLLNKAVKEGRLAKWRAPWNAPLGGFGLAPKTIYGLPHLNPQVQS